MPGEGISGDSVFGKTVYGEIISGAPSLAAQPEFELEPVLMLIEQRSGIIFAGPRLQAAQARLRAHAEHRRLASSADLLRFLRQSSTEYDALLDRLLFEPARFFRLAPAFECLSERVLPEMHMKKFWDQPRSLRVWSAGCGAGEEPYSIALAIADSLDAGEPWNIHLLASDVSQQAMQHAERGVYSADALAAVPAHQMEEFFLRAGDMYMVKPRLRHMVNFVRTNLIEAQYMGRFDVIFCTGVLALVRPDHRARLLQRFYECLEPGGYLFLSADDEVAELVRFDEVHRNGILLWQKPAGGALRMATLAAEMA